MVAVCPIYYRRFSSECPMQVAPTLQQSNSSGDAASCSQRHHHLQNNTGKWKAKSKVPSSWQLRYAVLPFADKRATDTRLSAALNILVTYYPFNGQINSSNHRSGILLKLSVHFCQLRTIKTMCNCLSIEQEARIFGI